MLVVPRQSQRGRTASTINSKNQLLLRVLLLCIGGIVWFTHGFPLRPSTSQHRPHGRTSPTTTTTSCSPTSTTKSVSFCADRSQQDQERAPAQPNRNKKSAGKPKQSASLHKLQQNRRPAHRQNNWNPAIQINKQITELGRKKDWNGLLELIIQEQRNLNNVNLATAMSQFGRIRSLNKSDPRFVSFLNVLAQIMKQKGLPWMQVRETSNIVHAIAKMQLNNQSTEQILDWISQPEVAAPFVKEGNPQDISNTALACATLGHDAPKLFAEIEQQSSWLVKKGNPQDISNTAWAFATLGYDAPKLFAEIEQQSSWLVNEGNPQAVANTAWAFATLGHDAPNLFAEIEQSMDKIIQGSNTQNIANMCYSITVLGMAKVHETLLQQLWNRAICLFDKGNHFDDKDLVQLAQTQMYAQADSVLLPSPPEKMLERINQALECLDVNRLSRLSMEISQLLQEIGFKHDVEVAPSASVAVDMLAIDFACTEQMIAIELDGPSHFLKALGTGVVTTFENGSTKAKRQYLQQLGWTVINIDYRAYTKAKQNANEKQWMLEILKDAGVSV